MNLRYAVGIAAVVAFSIALSLQAQTPPKADPAQRDKAKSFAEIRKSPAPWRKPGAKESKDKKAPTPEKKPAAKDAADAKSKAPAPPPISPIIVRRGGRLTIPVATSVGASPSLECKAAVGRTIPVTALAFSPDGKTLAAAGQREIVLWDLANARLLRRIAAGQLDGSVHALAFDKDGRSLAVGGGKPGQSGIVKLFDVQSGQPAADLSGPKDVVYALALSADGKLLAAGGADGLVHVWGIADKKPLTTIKDHSGWVLGVCFSPDGKYLATASADRTWLVFEVGTWKQVNKLQQTEPIQAAAFSPDGKLLAWALAGVQAKMVRVRQAVDEPEDKSAAAKKPPSSPPQIRQFDTGGGTPLDLAWNPPGTRLYVACADKSVKVFNATGGLQSTWTGHGDWVYCVAVSADGAKAASGSADGTVKLWATADNRPLATLVQLAPGKDDWLVLSGLGYFDASAPDKLEWKAAYRTTASDKLAEQLAKPESLREAIAGKKVAPPVLK